MMPFYFRRGKPVLNAPKAGPKFLPKPVSKPSCGCTK